MSFFGGTLPPTLGGLAQMAQAPKLNTGDVIFIDKTQYEVQSYLPSSDGYWIRDISADNYYFSTSFYTTTEVDQMYTSGRLTVPNKKIVGGASHNHTWNRYKGITDVYDYCDCGAKCEIDWRTLNGSN